MLLARFPFLSEASDFAQRHGGGIGALVESPSFSGARARGLQRVRDAIEKAEVSDVPLRTSEYDQLMEVLSYPYARMLVSTVDDRLLTRRYALAEAVRANLRLGEESQSSVIGVASELGVNGTIIDGQLRMHFSDFLRHATRIKSREWKMINNELFSGFVLLPEVRFRRVLQNALQDRLESELPLSVPPEFMDALATDLALIRNELDAMKSRFSVHVGEASIPDFPPCMRILLANAQAGVNLPHTGRFALTSFLHNIGMSVEEILALFAESPDFDESKSLYQIRHITGESSGTEYTPPVCATMKSYGICYEPDDLCAHERVRHPLTYYRIKTSGRRRR